MSAADRATDVNAVLCPPPTQSRPQKAGGGLAHTRRNDFTSCCVWGTPQCAGAQIPLATHCDDACHALHPPGTGRLQAPDDVGTLPAHTAPTPSGTHTLAAGVAEGRR